MNELYAVVVGAALGYLASIATEFWKSSRDDLRDLCKGFCEVVAEAADAGAEFWLTPTSEPDERILFARVAGFQSRLDGYATILDGRLDGEMLDEIESKLAALFQALTGGDPDDPARVLSSQRAYAVHDAAGDAIVAIRRAAFSRMSLKQRVYRHCTRSWVNRLRTMQLPPENPFPGNVPQIADQRREAVVLPNAPASAPAAAPVTKREP